jgi:hypothetical protein
MPDNLLYFGDNLDILRRYVPSESVDLVYLDAPFKSDQDYNILFREQDGTQAAAQRLGRRWIGIDITHLAITLIKHRLKDTFGASVAQAYQVKGEPTDLAGAAALARQDRYQFQWWAVGLVGARPTPKEQKKGADKGIDGRLYFHDEAEGRGQTKQVILSVKSGDLKATDVRDLRGVIEREKAEIGVLLCLDEPTKPMRVEAASAGFYHSPWTMKDHPRLQLLTVEELLSGKGIDMPPIRHTSQTFKKALKAKEGAGAQPSLPFGGKAETGEEE